MGTKKDSTIFDVAIYCRLSKEDLKEDGTVEQTIKIYYKFVGVLSNELHIKATKRYAAPLSPKRCQCCGAEFTPGSGVAKYCKPCAQKIHTQQSTESTRRRRAAARKAA